MSRNSTLTRQQARNLRKLASVLDRTPARLHDQGSWVEPAKEPCGTVCCALGLAALSGAFSDQGLGYGVQKPNGSWALTVEDAFKSLNARIRYRGELHPIRNGERRDFDDVGVELFGEDSYDRVFMRTGLNKPETVRALRAYASEYKGKL